MMQSAYRWCRERLASVTVMDSAVQARVGLRLLAQIGLLEDVGERDGQRQSHLWPVKSRIDMQTPMRDVAARLELSEPKFTA